MASIKSLEYWMPWSDSAGRYHHGSFWHSRQDASVLCETLNGDRGSTAKDWRPVRIPPPSQIEATVELLAALKLVRYPLELEEAIREYESNVAHAAIAKANGESAS